MHDLIFDVGIFDDDHSDNEFVDVAVTIGTFKYSEFLSCLEAEALSNYLHQVADEITKYSDELREYKDYT